MLLMELAADLNREFVPAVDSTTALSTTVKKGAVPKVTEIATRKSPASFDAKCVDATVSIVVAFATLVAPLAIGLVRIVVVLVLVPSGGAIAEIRLGRLAVDVEANKLLLVRRSSSLHLGIIVSTKLSGWFCISFISSDVVVALRIVVDDMMLSVDDNLLKSYLSVF